MMENGFVDLGIHSRFNASQPSTLKVGPITAADTKQINGWFHTAFLYCVNSDAI
jgi:hypothetical protein